jgi:beta-glucosidase
VKRIAVLGPLADRVVLHNYNGKTGKLISALQGIKDRVAAGTEITYGVGGMIGGKPHQWVKGVVDPPIDRAAELKKAVELARQADVAVVCIGTTGAVELEARDRTSLGLPGNQKELVKAVMAANPRTVVVLMSGGPLTVPWLKKNVSAMLQAWWGGEEMGHALADVLFGDVNPAGHLPHTVYASEEQVPPLDEYDVRKGFTYMYVKGDPLFPFGHGLSYTEFKYSDLTVTPKQLAPDSTATVRVTVENVGQRAGDEVVQLYVRAGESRVSRPARELRGFQRSTLNPGEKETVSFTLPAEKLAFYDVETHRFVVEPGAYDVLVGSSSQDIRLTGRLTVK